MVSNAGSSAGDGITPSIFSSALPALSAAQPVIRRGFTDARQKLAIMTKDVKTAISMRDRAFPGGRIIGSLYRPLENHTRDL